jgi:hypothetical protein
MESSQVEKMQPLLSGSFHNEHPEAKMFVPVPWISQTTAPLLRS